MSREVKQQIIVFAAIFLLIQLGFDLLQGVPISLPIFGRRVLTTLVATALYGVFLIWRSKRTKGEE